MKVIVLHFKDISDFPPVQNLINVLVEKNHQVLLITLDRGNYCRELYGKIETVVLPFEKEQSRILHLFGYIRNKWYVRKLLNQKCKEYNVVWTTTDNSVAVAGKRLRQFDKHIMQLMELVFDVPKFPAQHIIMTGLAGYAKHAHRVVVPEKTRGKILESIWNIDDKFEVLPNKLIVDCCDLPSEYASILERMKKLKNNGRRVILYQGIFSRERRLDEIAGYIEQNLDRFVLCILGSDNEERKRICNEYPNVEYLGYVPSPYHLSITKEADIGLLIYDAKRMESLEDKLNNLFCAPNKIFEFSRFGIPMIGNDIPGLYQVFQEAGIGLTCNMNSMDEIAAALRTIIENEDTFAKHCVDYYQSVDTSSIIERIVTSDP